MDRTAEHSQRSRSLLDRQQPIGREILETQRHSTVSLPIIVSATFTADQVAPSLRFWMGILEISAEIRIASYGQVMQELLGTDSALACNKDGVNVLLLRLDDWIRDRGARDDDLNVLEHLQRVANEFYDAARGSRARTSAALLIVFCPPAKHLSSPVSEMVGSLHFDLSERLKVIPGIYCWTPEDVSARYPVVEYEDPWTDQIAHIPYTEEYFVALGTIVARRIAALIKRRHKVIVVDCDNTLWQGICGEDGALGVFLTPAHLRFQRMLVQQHDAGVLLALCSKNNLDDVLSVFSQRTEMPLRQDHFIASYVNWDAKSTNIWRIARELDLSLDSFVVIDDSPVECSEIKSRCPSALTIQFPIAQEAIWEFLDHAWIFDLGVVSEEAGKRTEQYRQRRARALELEKAGDLEKFLASLELRIDISPMQAAQLDRVAELVQRTNQFNLTGVRRRAPEIESLWREGTYKIVVVHVQDRFGDYGLVGATIFRLSTTCLDVDTFVLSCRVLGRTVEREIVAELGRTAKAAERKSVLLRYRPTSRNAVAKQFLDAYFGEFLSTRCEGESGQDIYEIPADDRVTSGRALPYPTGSANELRTSVEQPAKDSGIFWDWHEVAFRLGGTKAIGQEVRRTVQPVGSRTIYVEPQTQMEMEITSIWSDVLNTPNIGVADEFFALGGDSLLAAQVSARIADRLGLDMPLYELLDQPTASQLARKLESATPVTGRIERGISDQPTILSRAQQRLWFIEQLEGATTAYQIPLAFRLIGPLDLEALQRSLDTIVCRHEVLRSIFVEVNGEPRQKVQPWVSFSLQSVDLLAEANVRPETALQSYIHREGKTAFDLRVDPPIRGTLLKQSAEDYILLVSMHHIVSDGWSTGVFLRELETLYGAYHSGRDDPLSPLSVQYADYARWHGEWLSGSELSEQLSFWLDSLKDAPEILALPTDYARPNIHTFRGGSVSVYLGRKLTDDLRAVCRQANMTLAMGLFAAWVVLLSKLSGQKDLVVGVPSANRPRIQLEGLIGLFVNTLPIRVRLEDDLDVRQFLEYVKKAMMSAYAHQEVPFDLIVEATHPARSLSHTPLVQTMFALQPKRETQFELPGVVVEEIATPSQTAQFDLLLSMRESAEGIIGTLNYASDLFEERTIQCWGDLFKVVVSALIRDTNQILGRLQLVPDRQRDVARGRATSVASETRRLHEIFEAQVALIPDSVAVTYRDQSLTYGLFNSRANKVARYLRTRGVGPDSLVGLCLERGLNLLVGILGILKAGAAYVPLDPSYPRARLAFMLADAKPTVVLVDGVLRDLCAIGFAQIIALDDDWSQIDKEPAADLDTSSAGVVARDLAYVIYTSGSTGQPKGVMVEHGNVTRLLKSTEHWFHFGRRDVWSLFHSYAFDFSVWEIWGALLYGGRVVVVPQRTAKDASEFLQVICREGVTVLNQTPSAFFSLMEAQLENLHWRHSLRLVIFGGEMLDPRILKPWIDQYRVDRPVLVNMYGITETTVHVTYQALSRRQIESGRGSVVGVPIPDLDVRLLDDHGQLVPTGVVGELYVAGDGLARGYLHRPELTAQRFVADVYGLVPGGRMYRTGDLGRWRSDGSIEYLGRNDLQVKIRGFRIELGEIEAVLARSEWVKEAVVLAREDSPGTQRLVAYIVPRERAEGSAAPTFDSMRRTLLGVLPEYMIPSALVLVKELPLTTHGKLDRAALPAPGLTAFASHTYEAPQGEAEEILAVIWQRLLAIDRVGRLDHFFELGGHSLLIMRMLEELRRAGLSAQVQQVFTRPRLSELAQTLERVSSSRFRVPENELSSECTTITPEMLPLVRLDQEQIDRIVETVPGGAQKVQDIYPLTPVQEGILFHCLVNEQHGDVYVTPTLLSVESRLRVYQLIAAIQAVIDRHDILRSAISWEGLSCPVQVVYRKALLLAEEVVLGPHCSVQDQITQWMKSRNQNLDLRRPPLMRVRFVADPAGSNYYLLLQMHHIVGDNISRELFISETVCRLQGMPMSHADNTPYRNHVAQVLARDPTAADRFFRDRLSDVYEPTAPFEILDVYGDGDRQLEASVELLPALNDRLRLLARSLGVNLASLFHAAWSLVVANTTGRDDVVFGTVLFGRMGNTSATHRSLGIFINTLPLRIRLQRTGAAELVRQAQTELAGLLQHEHASLSVAQKCSGIVGTAPLFTTLLNYRHNAIAPGSEWEGASGVRVVESLDRTNYPITVCVDDSVERIVVSIRADERIDIQRLLAYSHQAIESLAGALEHAPEAAASALTVLPNTELHRILEGLNDTRSSNRRDKSICSLFEEQVVRTPGGLAIISETDRLTYPDLNARANRLAHYLIMQGMQVGECVPIDMPRGVGLLIAQLAILKAGGVYVPVDSQLPSTRKAFIIRDCRARIIICENFEWDGLEFSSLLKIDPNEVSDVLENLPTANPNVEIDPGFPAYVMYTSGSTGLPKGVIVSQRAINRIAVDNGYARLGPDDRVCHSSNPAFDASTFEIWAALLNGSAVVIVPHSTVMDSHSFAGALAKHRVSALWLTAGLFAQYRDVLAPIMRQFKYLLVGGDIVDIEAARDVLKRGGPKYFLNAYGPTEGTTFSTTYTISAIEGGTTSLPIGKPIADTQIYVLDRLMKPLPLEVTGELFIGGAGVALGYLHRPELTAERFVANPFGEPGSRLYRSGDLARWNRYGNVEFVGRGDQQIKLRGFRIELGDIEAQLVKHIGVKEAVALMREDLTGQKRVVAYVTARGLPETLTVESLRESVRKALPEYMVPSAFVILNRLPLTVNGKVDRRALPRPDAAAFVTHAYEAPEGEIENGLAELWRTLLGVERVGREDSFFELGGHSLLATQLIGRIRTIWAAEIPFRTLFQSPTLRGLSTQVLALLRSEIPGTSQNSASMERQRA